MTNKSALISLLVIIGIFLVAGVLIYQHNDPIMPQSSFSLSPTQPANGSPAPQPAVGSWNSYSNDKFNFSLEVPADWNQQEYAPATGETIIAFSPDQLPCGTCTYFRNGYMSVHVYNQKSAPDLYATFQERVKAIGKSAEYRQVALDGQPAVLFANTVSVEQQNWVYELDLDTNDGKTNLTDSYIYQRAANSFKFTGLSFIK